jgi:transposase
VAGDIVLSKNEQFVLQVIEDFRAQRITCERAAELLGKSPRTVKRLAKRIREKGAGGLKHGNAGRSPANKTDDATKQRSVSLAREIYYDFNLDHCREMLKANHHIALSYSTFNRWCRAAKLGKRKRRRGSKKRMLRDRMACEGLLLQMDGSDEEWFGGRRSTLVAAIDDATSEIAYGGFFDAENTWSCMRVLRRIIELKGIPVAIYVDQAGWYAGPLGRQYSQFVRACEELGIRVITALSPEAKGRIERAWNTFQDRLIPELRLAGISAMREANDYLNERFLPGYWNRRNTVVAADATSRYQSVPPWLKLDEIFCLKEMRQVRRDHTIHFRNEIYKLTAGYVGNLRGRDVTVHEYEDGSWQAFYGTMRLTLQHAPKPKRRWREGA